MLDLLMKWLQGRFTNRSQLNIFLSGSVELVKEMINQVAQLHLGIQWFHVGADEVGNEPLFFTNWGKNSYFIIHSKIIPSLKTS